MEHERCTACGFDGGRYDDDALLDALRELGSRWRALLFNAQSELRSRPQPEVWSAIEYAAHSRDITSLHAFGVEQALTGEEPRYPEVDNDLVTAVASDYATADPGEVADELEEQAQRMADLALRAGPAAWSRGLTLGDERIEVRRLMEHALHDSQHHLADVEHGLLIVRTRPSLKSD
ncbi:MAG: DinB family protein [Acidimicrobiales bacterium]